jgi:hypothetical protein
MADDSIPDTGAGRYSPDAISPGEFEEFVAELLGSAAPLVTGMVVTPHEKIRGVDGEYDFDATVRYELWGLSFLVLAEAKRHKNPIKRELVQILHQKVQSVGAHKGVMISTAPYQRGAIDFARTHGVALVTVVKEPRRVEIVNRLGTRVRPLPPRRSRGWLNGGSLVGVYYGDHSQAGSIHPTPISPDRPDRVAELLLGCPIDERRAQDG